MEYLPLIIAVLFLISLSALFLVYACCRVAGQCSREEERRWKERRE